MSRDPFHTLSARAVLLVRDDIDTDQIIPARFLTTTSREGLGEHLFSDWRYDAERKPKADFPLNRAASQGARILVAGRNFGCGSSREHAPWALADWGIQAVIATSFADIFTSNANKNGVVTVALSIGKHASLVALLERTPASIVTVDLANQQVVVASANGVDAHNEGDAVNKTNTDNVYLASFAIDPFTKRCLIEGIDELGYLQLADADITTFENRRQHATINTRSVLNMRDLTSTALKNARSTVLAGEVNR